jgi:mono/diheme cytochrome c family protein
MTGCQSLPPSEPAVPSGPHPGLAFAQGACGGCHAVERYGLSPNPDAPPFAAIINRENLTPETLSSWLRDAHNYPEEMEFYLEQAEVDALVRYMLTLEDESYRPRNSS